MQKAWDDDPEKMSPDDVREHLEGLSPEEFKVLSNEYGVKGTRGDRTDKIVEKIHPTLGAEVFPTRISRRDRSIQKFIVCAKKPTNIH